MRKRILGGSGLMTKAQKVRRKKRNKAARKARKLNR